jgi:hypothetical protein
MRRVYRLILVLALLPVASAGNATLSATYEGTDGKVSAVRNCETAGPQCRPLTTSGGHNKRQRRVSTSVMRHFRLRGNMRALLLACLSIALMAPLSPLLPSAAASEPFGPLCPVLANPVRVCVEDFRNPVPFLVGPSVHDRPVRVQVFPYAFDVGGAASQVVVVPCVVVHENETTMDPCAGLGGERREPAVFDAEGTYKRPGPPLRPLLYIVEADLTAMVGPFGIEREPVVVLCREPDCALP